MSVLQWLIAIFNDRPLPSLPVINWRGLIPLLTRNHPETWGLARPQGSGHYNEVMPDRAAIIEAISSLGWQHPTPPKTWDLLKTLRYLSHHYSARGTRVLDMGCVGSPVLEVLYGWGYRSLAGVDFGRRDLPRVPGLDFAPGSLTDTRWEDNSFDVITCLSVLEHGVPLEAFVEEADRLLSSRGSLMLSVDYHGEPIDTSLVPREATFGLPWSVFDRAMAESLIALARSRGFGLVDEVNWDQRESPVSWNGKSYTFLFLAFSRT